MSDPMSAPVSQQEFKAYKDQVESAFQRLKDEIDSLLGRIAELESSRL